MNRTGRSPLRFLIVATAVALGLAAAATAADQPAPPATVNDGIVAYYFHGNVRCATCRAIEAQAERAIHEAFAAQLEDGTLAWQVVNLEQPENEHFTHDFQLTTKSVVLAEYRDGKVVRFANLDQVWQLVRSEDRFAAYVQDETRRFLTAG